MAWVLEQMLVPSKGRRGVLAALLIGLLMGLSNGLFWIHLYKLLLEYWKSLGVRQLISVQSLTTFLTVFICSCIDSVAMTILMLASRYPRLTGPVCVPFLLLAMSSSGAMFGAVFFARPLLYGLLSTPLSLITLVCFVVTVSIICGLLYCLSGSCYSFLYLLSQSPTMYLIPKLYRALGQKIQEFLQGRTSPTSESEGRHTFGQVLITLIPVCVTFMNALSFVTFGHVGHVKISVLFNVLLPLQFVPRSERTVTLSGKAARDCGLYVFWSLMFLTVLMKCALLMGVGPTIGATMGLEAMFRHFVIVAGKLMRGFENGRLVVTLGAMLGALVAFYFY